jgi:hypothetical protein
MDVNVECISFLGTHKCNGCNLEGLSIAGEG